MNKFDEIIEKDGDKFNIYKSLFDFCIDNKELFCDHESGVYVSRLNNYDNSYFITVTIRDSSNPNSLAARLKTICNNDLFVELKLGGKSHYKTVFNAISVSEKYSKYGFTLVDISHDVNKDKYYFVATIE